MADCLGNVTGSTVHDFVVMVGNAVSQPGPWSFVAVILVGVSVAAAVRSKLSASWVWIPVLAGAIYFTVFRWLRLR